MTDYWCNELRWNWVGGKLELYCRKQYVIDEITDPRCRLEIKGTRAYCSNEKFVGLVEDMVTIDEKIEELLEEKKSLK